jgi:Ca2+-binding RTX toxin-like protein
MTRLYGGAGNDTLNGGSGADYLAGGDGDDVYLFDGNSGVDVIDDTRGNSTLYISSKPIKTVLEENSAVIYLSENGDNRIQFSLGSLNHVGGVYFNSEIINLKITAPDENGNYTSNGHTYDSYFIGGTQGNDDFIFSDAYKGQFSLYGFDGNDSIEVAESWENNGYVDVNVISDRLYKTEGYWTGNYYEYVNYYATDYLLNNHANPSGTIKIYNDEWSPEEIIQFGSGEVANLHIIGNAEYNIIYGKTGSDWISGDGGNDTLYGGAGNDTLEGGSGIDILYGEAGDDILYVDGSDAAWGGAGNDVFLAVANTTSGKVNGGEGADIFKVKAEDYSDYIITDTLFDAGDIIQLDVNSDAVHLLSDGIEILSSDKSEVDHIGVLYLRDVARDELWDRMQDLTIQFANGETWNVDQIKSRLAAGTVFSDVIVGDASDNIIHGLAGNDTLYGLAGNDTLYGDAGDDLLIGGTGNDTFHFGAGMGNDVIDERYDGGWHDDADIIQFDSSFLQSNISLSHSNADLVVSLANSGEKLTLAGFLAEDETNKRNISLSFSNGVVWNIAYIERGLFRKDSGLQLSGTATADNDLITGTSAANYIYGDAGNDTIDGKSGNDWIDGGAGNDILTGGSGSDTFRFGAGSGQDVIKDNAAAIVSDRVRLDFTTGISDLTVEVLASTNELKIGRHDAAGAITDSVKVNKALGNLVDIQGSDLMIESSSLLQMINGQLANSTITLANNETGDRYVIFSAVDLLGNNLSNIEKSRWQITGATKLSGAFGVADLDGNGSAEEGFALIEDFWGSGINYVGFVPSNSAGNASFQFTLQRDDGLTFVSSMTVNVQAGSLSGTSGNDIIDGAHATDIELVINALAGDDLVRDGECNDVIHGGDGNDVLTYNWAVNGDDVYSGDAGNDTLDAGMGTDTMVGGSGNDLYIEGNLWSGDHTTIDNSTAAVGDIDTLQIGGGTQDYRSMWFTQAGNDLVATQLDAQGAGDIRIKGWFDAANPEAKLDVIRVQQDDGSVYETHVDLHFDALVQAMAGFTPPASVGTINSSLNDEYQAAWMLTTPMAA